MTNSTKSRHIRQYGLTLIDFMVGLTIGLLVVLAAMGSLVMLRSSARTMTDSAALEQQATLVMMQIGQQISQAGAINAYVNGSNPDAGVTGNNVTPGLYGYIQFDARPLQTVNPYNPGIPVFGTDGGGTDPDTLSVNYAASNDGSMARNCIGNKAGTRVASNAPSIISVFRIRRNPGNAHDPSDLICGDGDPTHSPQPIAGNVVDMQVKYWLNGRLQNAEAAMAWAQVNGLEVCLEVQGEPTQAPEQIFQSGAACWNTAKVIRNDGRIHRFVKQTFYLPNTS